MDLSKQLSNIYKEGNLQKQSRFLKSWRDRWVVLGRNYIFTFKEKKVYNKPTETIGISEVVGIKSHKDEQKPFCFEIRTKEDQTFLFSAENNEEKEVWMGQLNKAIMKKNMKGEDD